MQSLNDYEEVTRSTEDIFDIPDGMLDFPICDLSYFSSYSSGSVLEHIWELGDAEYDLRRQLSHHGSNTEGLDQGTLSNLITYDERQPDTLLNTTWSKRKDRGQLTALATPPTPSGNSGVVAPTTHIRLASPMSPLSLPSPVITTANPEDKNALLQKKRDKNRAAGVRYRGKTKRRAYKLEELERDLRQTNEMLQVEAKGLQEKVLNLKADIFCHSRCNCDLIQRYIQRAAEQAGQEIQQDSNVLR